MKQFWRWFFIVLIIVAVLAPLLVQVVWSFAFRWYFPDLLPSEWGLNAWRYVFSDSSRVGEALITSLSIAIHEALILEWITFCI